MVTGQVHVIDFQWSGRGFASRGWRRGNGQISIMSLIILLILKPNLLVSIPLCVFSHTARCYFIFLRTMLRYNCQVRKKCSVRKSNRWPPKFHFSLKCLRPVSPTKIIDRQYMVQKYDSTWLSGFIVLLFSCLARQQWNMSSGFRIPLERVT